MPSKTAVSLAGVLQRTLTGHQNAVTAVAFTRKWYEGKTEEHFGGARHEKGNSSASLTLATSATHSFSLFLGLLVFSYPPFPLSLLLFAFRFVAFFSAAVLCGFGWRSHCLEFPIP